MKIIFFGMGPSGQRHAKILQENYQHELFAFRSGGAEEPDLTGIRQLHSWAEVTDLKPDVAFITSPTPLHIETAIKCAQEGYKLFIENPIGKDTDGLQILINMISEKNLVTYLAYNLRFHPVIKEITKYLKVKKPLCARVVCASILPAWKPNTNYFTNYSVSSVMGGGVILDLSHEMDYISFLFGGISRIAGNCARIGSVTADTEDFADILILARNIPVNIHLDFLSQIRQRYIQIDFEGLTIMGDLTKAEVIEYEGGKVKDTLKLEYEQDQEYKDQLKYFFDNIDNPKMMNNLIEASELYRRIISFKNEH